MTEAMTPQQRLAIQRVIMPEQDAGVRSGNFTEVNLGLTHEQAMAEAQRCLQCKSRVCVDGCPVQVGIPEFIAAVANDDLPGAARILQQDNALPAVCGRVCPQENQCEARCVRGVKGEAVAIGYLERYVADWAMMHDGELENSGPITPSGKSVAVVGSGPCGLAAAGDLIRHGHQVTIFEALHDTGGVLRYGIPEFRLPKTIVDEEVSRLEALGVEIQCNVVVGKTLTIDQLKDVFDAVLISNGAGLPMMMNIPGEHLKGVYAANEYLTRVNLMGAGRLADSPTPILQGKRVAVVGAGNTAMDCVRTARRLGAEQAMIVYRRSEAQMPARREEVHHAKAEGVEFVMLSSPLEILGNEQGWATALRCQKMRLGEPDASWRQRPEPIDGETIDLAVDVVVNALGTRPNPLLTATAPHLELQPSGQIRIDDDARTNLPGIYAGGDITRGGSTVILAMGDGKRAASRIHQVLSGG